MNIPKAYCKWKSVFRKASECNHPIKARRKGSDFSCLSFAISLLIVIALLCLCILYSLYSLWLLCSTALDKSILLVFVLALISICKSYYHTDWRKKIHTRISQSGILFILTSQSDLFHIWSITLKSVDLKVPGLWLRAIFIVN